jgi:hypothetical protein
MAGGLLVGRVGVQACAGADNETGCCCWLLLVGFCCWQVYVLSGEQAGRQGKLLNIDGMEGVLRLNMEDGSASLVIVPMAEIAKFDMEL